MRRQNGRAVARGVQESDRQIARDLVRIITYNRLCCRIDHSPNTGLAITPAR